MALPLPATIADKNAPDNRVRIGIVNSVDPLMVDIQGTPIPMGRASNFFPQVGQAVSVVRQDGSWFVVDRSQSPDDSTPREQAGTTIVNVAAVGSVVVNVTFDRPFASQPAMVANIHSGTGATAGWDVRCISVTESSFQLFLFGPVSTFGVGVMWIAREVTQ